MKKLILTAVGVAMAATTAFGVPARRDWRTFTQTDGTTITVRLVGDENFHAYVTADGNFRYITADGTTSAIAHDAANRDEAENSFVATNACTLKSLHQASMATPRRAREISKANENESQVPTLGAPRIPVLLLAYADYDFRDGKNAINTFTEFFESGDESARQYFVDQSNGKYTPQFDIYGPYTLSKNRSAYGGNIGDYDRGVGTMVGEGCQGLDNSIDFSKYDNDGDGECDVVIVIYAGDGEASSDAPDAANAVWPCQWELSSSDFGKSLRLDGVKVDKFGVFNELSGFDLSEIDGIGTFCHEFSHCLGLPDFYCTNDYSNYFGMSDWSLMDYGCYNNEGYTPIGYSAYEKNFMGWIDYVEPQDNTRYTLPVFNSKNAANDVALKITNPTNSNEYYIVENRARQGWDRYIYGEGLALGQQRSKQLQPARNDHHPCRQRAQQHQGLLACRRPLALQRQRRPDRRLAPGRHTQPRLAEVYGQAPDRNDTQQRRYHLALVCQRRTSGRIAPRNHIGKPHLHLNYGHMEPSARNRRDLLAADPPPQRS